MSGYEPGKRVVRIVCTGPGPRSGPHKERFVAGYGVGADGTVTSWGVDSRLRWEVPDGSRLRWEDPELAEPWVGASSGRAWECGQCGRRRALTTDTFWQVVEGCVASGMKKFDLGNT